MLLSICKCFFLNRIKDKVYKLHLVIFTFKSKSETRHKRLKHNTQTCPQSEFDLEGDQNWGILTQHFVPCKVFSVKYVKYVTHTVCMYLSLTGSCVNQVISANFSIEQQKKQVHLCLLIAYI